MQLRCNAPTFLIVVHQEYAAFAYIHAFKARVNVGFFRDAELADPNGLLAGTGKSMRHVKLRPGLPADHAALRRLIRAAYIDIADGKAPRTGLADGSLTSDSE
ncbi:MAG: DUF1801 domain-containing protein [Gammaproteobacteria bacterium]